MSTGAQRVDAQPGNGVIAIEQDDWTMASGDEEAAEDAAWTPPPPIEVEGSDSRIGPALVLLALAWLGFTLWHAFRTEVVLDTGAVIEWAALTSGPLVLIGLFWLMFGRGPRRETERFTRAVIAMRGESAALESVLQLVAERLEENQKRLTHEAAKLMALGDEASDRLGRVTYYLSKETAKLDQKSEALEAAAANAKVDLGVLLCDLPKAEEQARMIAAAMKDAGLAAHSQAGALEGQLSALVARGREADEVVGGAAQRLGAHLARIESTTSAATGRMDEAAASMSGAVDATMARAAEAVDAARAGLEAQGTAMLAMIEQSRAALDRAGEDAGRNLSQRLDAIGGKIEALASHLAAQDAASHALVDGLGRELEALDERFARLRESGGASSEQIAHAVESVRAQVSTLSDELGGGHERATELIERAQEMAAALGSATRELSGPLPEALAQVEEQAERARGATAAIVPKVEAVLNGTNAAAAKLAAGEVAVSRQQEAVEAMLANLGGGLDGAEGRLRALGQAAAEADRAAARIVSATGPELVEALVRVREAANQAAGHARDAISAVIPHSAAALGEASRRAVSEAILGQVEAQMKAIGQVSEQAVETARKASERLTRQMVTIGEVTKAVEERIDEARIEQETRESDNFSRRVALLIESLNSTAIDVTKILSNEVSDAAWQAYLKGDRGVFTRRAVRLLDTSEAREILQHYESEPEFRDQVNRYIHDFEAMLRRILAGRDSAALSVTILSSDMGKLYVALAQAIDRLRN